MHGPLVGSMDFAVSRPKTHYRTGRFAHLLRDDSPPEPDVKPDLSKLLRAAEDAMTGIVWADDCQITEYARQGDVPALRMHYAGEKTDGLDRPGVRIVVSQSG
jgi:Holliday junction resolvase RusA-like endonuclease